jgi:hypothetical protein
VRGRAEAFRRLYGAGPLHLAGALACFAVVGLAVAGWLEEPWETLKYILIWFAGALLAHDLLFLPIYAALDHLATWRSRSARPARPRGRPGPWVYVRVPLILSGLIGLVFWPEILEEGDATFLIASGQHQHVYLGRYLILVACLFGLSLLAYLSGRGRAARRAQQDAGGGAPPASTARASAAGDGPRQ